MRRPDVIIFHRPAGAGEPPLVRFLAAARACLVEHQAQLFRDAGAGTIRIETEWQPGRSFGAVLADHAPTAGGLVVMGSGAVARLNASDARQLVAAAAGGSRVALTNNLYSSDICAIGQAAALRDLPPLPTDNALPRWLEEQGGYAVVELAGRDRLALDLDSPLDVALAAVAPRAPRWLRELADAGGIAVPRGDDLRRLAADSRRELLVFGRAGSPTLRWLERNVRCRVRFLAEERGLRAATGLASGVITTAPDAVRPPRATIGRLLAERGPAALAEVVSELADGAILDTRVLLADRLGADERAWPSAADRFASDLLRPDEVADPWLRELTVSAAASRLPIVLGGHTLVGPGVAILLAGVTARRSARHTTRTL
jgi:hypothetical protein